MQRSGVEIHLESLVDSAFPWVGDRVIKILSAYTFMPQLWVGFLLQYCRDLVQVKILQQSKVLPKLTMAPGTSCRLSTLTIAIALLHSLN